MKVKFYRDERYPDYTITENDGHSDCEIEMTQEEIDRFKKVEEEYDECQNLVRERHENQ